MNPIAGRTHVTIAGERRELVCDMNAASVFFDTPGIGEHWPLWLIERFIGKREKTHEDDVQTKATYRLPALSPADLAITLHALTASDREDRGSDETVKEFRRGIGPGQMAALQAACTRTVIASFGVPGKDLEVAENA